MALAARRAVVVCPASLVNNWAAELQKWLQGRCPCTAVADSCKDKVVSKFEGFKYDRQVRERCHCMAVVVLTRVRACNIAIDR